MLISTVSFTKNDKLNLWSWHIFCLVVESTLTLLTYHSFRGKQAYQERRLAVLSFVFLQVPFFQLFESNSHCPQTFLIGGARFYIISAVTLRLSARFQFQDSLPPNSFVIPLQAGSFRGIHLNYRMAGNVSYQPFNAPSHEQAARRGMMTFSQQQV